MPSEPIGPGRFCKLIGSAADSRICLTVQDGQLQKIGSEHLQQIVEHVPSISLADILERCYHFTAKMKLALAYILTYSAWQYYDSGWMKRRWTSETIHFVKECGRNGAGKQSELFAWKPYLSAHFGDEDLASGDFRDVDGEIHRYPRLRALGIMLVEIGIGKSLRRSDEEHPARSLAAKTNKELLLAIQYSKEEKLWGDCYYPKYLYAIDRCLDPGTFALAPCARGVDDRAKVEGLEQRKKFLYDQVVLPLEELLHGTGWMEQITAIGPLFAERRAADKCFADDAAVKPSAAREASKKSLTESQRKAKSWLWEMQHLNTELAQTFPQIGPGHFSERIRIAVLDTGCDNDAPFFHLPDNGPRLKQWKDWVDGSASWQDLHGHGTHLVSLIMRIAPEADIYVARIAESPDQLMKAGENVAEVWHFTRWVAESRVSRLTN